MTDHRILLKALDVAEHGIFVTDAHSHITYCNPGFERITGYERESLIGHPMKTLSSGLTSPHVYAQLWQTIADGETWRGVVDNRRADGSLYTTFQVITPIVEDGQVTGYLGIQHDITAERAADRDARAVLDNTCDAMFLIEVREDGRFTFARVNDTYRRLSGIGERSVEGLTPADLLEHERAETLVEALRSCVSSRSPVKLEDEFVASRGNYGSGPPGGADFGQWWHTIVSPVIVADRVQALVGSSRDISDRREMEERLRFLSEMDPLTGIANRRKIGDELERELARAQRHGRPLSLFIADVDHFKSVNDNYGHEVGDAVLRSIAATLQATLRPSDRLGRWGGEEFVALLPETGLEGVLSVAERVREAVAESRVVTDHTVTISIGVTAMPAGPPTTGNHLAFTPDDLLRAADEELYRAKELGRNRVAGGSQPATG